MSDHTDGCSYQSCTCKPGPMTEQEAAERLAALLNEIQAAGHGCAIVIGHNGRYDIGVGEAFNVAEPVFDDGEWMVVQ